ncbi:Neurogenic locus notch 3 [Merluccius polli]|uniref:Neurogenic locus notch 3 n=1 Tax=Merluccius polli TaxID=89951 RepID=A0AA47NB91_MERPO|nr:Neurogenic locus notch 3 [Merluccius polli]
MPTSGSQRGGGACRPDDLWWKSRRGGHDARIGVTQRNGETPECVGRLLVFTEYAHKCLPAHGVYYLGVYLPRCLPCPGSNPCEHTGKCLNTKGSFQCECQRGYAGARCQLDINECMSNPCLNEATCLDLMGDLHCICMAGFSGKHCEQNIDDCPGHECENGLCVDGVNTYTCQCKPEYTGQLCKDDVDECQLTPNACQNGGTCHNTHGSYQCVCVNGWAGI